MAYQMADWMAWKLEWNLAEQMAAWKAGQTALYLVEHWVASMAEPLVKQMVVMKVEQTVVCLALMKVDY
jgi:hypothetical protein